MSTRHVLSQIPARKIWEMGVGVDHGLYRLRTIVERCENKLKTPAASRRDITKLLKATSGLSSSPQSGFG